MADRRYRFKPDGDVGLGVFDRIGDQLIHNKTERQGERRGNLVIRTLDDDGFIELIVEQQVGEIVA
jgi:hypothetical protein